MSRMHTNHTSAEHKRVAPDKKRSISAFQRWKIKRKRWLAALSPKERLVRRILLVFMVLALIILAAAACFLHFVKPPELSNTGGSAPSGITADGEGITNIERAEGFYTFLVVGQDVASGNTDTIMLVSFDVTNGKLNVLSIPRDTMVNVSWSVKKINSVYQVAGMDRLKEVVEDTTGILPDFTVLIQWTAVGEMVEAMGGVDYDVPYDMNYEDPAQDLYIHLNAGMQHLDGEHAMQLVRWRKNNDGSGVAFGDAQRIEIQHDFLLEVAKQLLQPKNVTKIPDFAEVFEKNVETDLTAGNILWFAQQIMITNVENIQFFTLPADMNGSYNGLSYVFPYPDEIAEMMQEYFNPYETPITTASLQVMQKKRDGTMYVTNGTLADAKVGLVSNVSSSASTQVDDDPPSIPDTTQPSQTESSTASQGTPSDSGTTSSQGTPSSTPSQTQPSVTQPSDTRPSDTQPSDTQPSDTQPSDTQPSDTQPSDTQPNDTQPSDTQPSDTQPSDTQPSDTQPSNSNPNETQPDDIRSVTGQLSDPEGNAA